MNMEKMILLIQIYYGKWLKWKWERSLKYGASKKGKFQEKKRK